MKKILLASTSTIYGGTYLSYLEDELKSFFKGIDEILFIPFARPSGISHDEYTEIAQKGFSSVANPIEAIKQAKAIFTGGGNTFLLVTKLYELGLMDVLQKVIFNGTFYMGTSAGSNIAGKTMQTTNDMPIIYPPSFNTLGLVPFNINPHYLDTDPNSKHKGETRETRIKEFHKLNDIPVIENDKVYLKGEFTARIFEQNKEPYEWNGEEQLPFFTQN